MKVALLNTSWYPDTGGGIVHVEELAKRLATNHDCEVDIISKRTDTAKTDRTGQLPDGVSVKQICGTDSGFRVINELSYTAGTVVQALRANYDIIHAHSNTATFPLQLLRFTDAATVFTVHGASLDLSVTYAGSSLDVIYSLVRRIILHQFQYDAMISVNDKLASILSSHHDRVEFIPNGVDVKAFPEPSEFSKEILFVGRLRPKKNPVDLVEAMPAVLDRHPEAKLHVVGEGPLEDDVVNAIRGHDLGDAVSVYGRVSDETLMELYRDSSVFVLPSDWEGHPLVLLEAWASGQVVVGTRVEGIREFVEGTSFGSLVPLDSPDELAVAISDYFDDPKGTLEAGKAARNHVSTNYTWARTANRTYQLYRTILEEPPDRGEYSRP